tara:strand:+ start:376 stop:849 length:474 start_codon:yes stop_codon:yes gene_type:complete
MIMTPDFQQMSSKELVSFYNNWEGVKPIKKFRDHATGVKRCEQLSRVLQEIKEGGVVDPETELKIEEAPKVLTRRQTMSTSLQLDRTIIVYDIEGSSLGMFGNVHQLWKAYPKWVTGAQVDRLTRVLYTAAKAGIRGSVTINERTFELAQSGLKRNG